jgi:DNA-binding response OmpR family regulator
VVGWAGGTERALAVARDADIDAALLDVNLGGQDTFAVAVEGQFADPGSRASPGRANSPGR